MSHRSGVTLALFMIISVCTDGHAQTTFAEFADCIGPNAGSFGSTCTLPYSASAYTIDPALGFYSANSGPPLTVTRSNITVTGAGTWPNVSTLQRSSANGGTPFSIVTVTGSNVTVETLIIDGNRFGLVGLDCLTGPAWTDLDGSNAPHLKVQYIQMDNAPRVALELPVSASVSPLDVYVYNSLFRYSRHVAILARENDVIDYNTIDYAGINGAQTYGGGGQLFEYNTFYHNHDEWWTNTTGGQLIIYDDAPGVTVIDNYFDGGNALCPSTGCSPNGCPVYVGSDLGTNGIEHYGANGVFTNNEIKNHAKQPGFLLRGIDGFTFNGIDSGFTTYTIHDNDTGLGILSWSTAPRGTWTISDLEAVNNLNGSTKVGVFAPISGTTVNWGSGACLTGNVSPYTFGSGWTLPASTTYNCR